MHHFESLENRQLLSATVHSAAKTKPTIPNIIETFVGTTTQRKPTSGSSLQVALDFTNESNKGVLSGIYTNNTTDKTGSIAGKITVKDALSIKILDSQGITDATVKGKYNPTTQQLTGTYTTPASKGARATSGTFSLNSQILMG